MKAVERNAKTKKRDAKATRQALLEAALRRFAAHGYDQVGLRDIAADVGVDPALVNRYFGTKANLFAQSVARNMAFATLLEGPRAELGQRLAHYVVQKGSQGGSLDPLLAQIRSSANEEARAIFREQLERHFIAPLASWLGGENAHERAGLVAAELAGLATMRTILGVRVLNQEDAEGLTERVGRTLQTYIDG